MPPDPGRPAEALRRAGVPPSARRTPDQWIRSQLKRKAGEPSQVPAPAREDPPAAPRMPIEALRPGALPASEPRARDPDQWIRDQLER